MDFSIFTTAGIDHSPAPWITRITLVLEEPELRQADRDQFRRFWEVWHLNRSLYAPKLCEVTLALRPGFMDGAMDLRGINAFLDYYRLHIEPICTTKGLHVYLDCYSAIVDHTQSQVLEQPLLLFTIAQTQMCVGDEWPILPASAFGAAAPSLVS